MATIQPVITIVPAANLADLTINTHISNIIPPYSFSNNELKLNENKVGSYNQSGSQLTIVFDNLTHKENFNKLLVDHGNRLYTEFMKIKKDFEIKLSTNTDVNKELSVLLEKDIDPVDELTNWDPYISNELVKLRPELLREKDYIDNQRKRVLTETATKEDLFLKQEKTFKGSIIILLISIVIAFFSMNQSSWSYESIGAELIKIGGFLTTIYLGFNDYIRTRWRASSLTLFCIKLIKNIRKFEYKIKILESIVLEVSTNITNRNVFNIINVDVDRKDEWKEEKKYVKI